MKSDALFFLGIIAFFFILWYASGGPNKPISFAGPYITPITDVDTVQQGYGGDATYGSSSGGNLWTDIMGLQDRVATLQRKSSDIKAFGQASPIKGSVTVTSAAGAAATDPDQEYVTVRNNGSESVDITGWRVVSGASGESERIPEGSLIPSTGRINDTDDIVLAPGDSAIITTGESPIGVSFKENMCVGYLSKNQTFYPSASNSCPAARDEFDRFFTGNKLSDDTCYNLIQSTPTCAVPKESGKRLSNPCLKLIDEHLTYNGCVDTHRYDVRFSGTTWRIYLEHENRKGKEAELWKSSRDAVKLIDQNGLTVDLYTY